jgi:hypothetical protein
MTGTEINEQYWLTSLINREQVHREAQIRAREGKNVVVHDHSQSAGSGCAYGCYLYTPDGRCVPYEESVK